MNLIIHWNFLQISPKVVDKLMVEFLDYKDGWEMTCFPSHISYRYYYYNLTDKLVQKVQTPRFKDALRLNKIEFLLTEKFNHNFD